MIVMGIDGGGSNLRVALMDDMLTLLVQRQYGSVNPNVIGRDEAAALICEAMREVIALAGLTAVQVAGVGIGIAGAPANREAAWLRAVVAEVVPSAHIVPSADQEIALVAARGERYGLLILAGTGSNVYGVNREGDSVQVGGWGYLLGDEGSGYWISMEALRAVVRHHDGRGFGTRLTDAILARLNLDTPEHLIPWLYEGSHHREVATLAQLVLEMVDRDSMAKAIIDRAAQELKTQADAALKRLHVTSLPVAFTGGLLEHANPLSLRLCELLELDALPPVKHPQVVGAGLLALQALRGLSIGQS